MLNTPKERLALSWKLIESVNTAKIEGWPDH